MALLLFTVFSQCAVCLKAKWEERNVLLFSSWLLSAYSHCHYLKLEDELFENNLRKGLES